MAEALELRMRKGNARPDRRRAQLFPRRQRVPALVGARAALFAHPFGEEAQHVLLGLERHIQIDVGGLDQVCNADHLGLR